MKYTKGEWKVVEFTQEHHGAHDIGIVSANGFQVCGLERDYSYPLAMPKDEVIDNAHLIAAAPDMYEALKEAWAYLAPKCHDPKAKIICDKAGEALAKAEGK